MLNVPVESRSRNTDRLLQEDHLRVNLESSTKFTALKKLKRQLLYVPLTAPFFIQDGFPVQNKDKQKRARI